MSDQRPNVTFGTIGTAQGNVHGGIHNVRLAGGNMEGDTYNNSPIVHGNTYSGAGAGQQYHQDNSGNLGNQINGGTFSGATFNQPIHHGAHND
uniref:Uncharacterized protein n=1 Tax=Plectus sambesii TaxID=2011161 RepID=A0A914URP8_9BILA